MARRVLVPTCSSFCSMLMLRGADGDGCSVRVSAAAPSSAPLLLVLPLLLLLLLLPLLLLLLLLLLVGEWSSMGGNDNSAFCCCCCCFPPPPVSREGWARDKEFCWFEPLSFCCPWPWPLCGEGCERDRARTDEVSLPQGVPYASPPPPTGSSKMTSRQSGSKAIRQ